MNMKGKKETPTKETTGPYPPLRSGVDCSTAGGVGNIAAALAKVIVTADVSPSGNLGARGSSWGGGRGN